MMLSMYRIPPMTMIVFQGTLRRKLDRLFDGGVLGGGGEDDGLVCTGGDGTGWPVIFFGI
jgi:hypothetical protein